VSKGGRECGLAEYSDHDASWGHRSPVSTRKGGGFYCYRIHAAVCVRTGLPVPWEIASAHANESTFAAPLIEATKAHGFAPSTVAMDKGYDVGPSTPSSRTRRSAIIRLRETIAVKRGSIAHQAASMASGGSLAPSPYKVRPRGAVLPAPAPQQAGGPWRAASISCPA
jgi:hypothetical protein